MHVICMWMYWFPFPSKGHSLKFKLLPKPCRRVLGHKHSLHGWSFHQFFRHERWLLEELQPQMGGPEKKMIGSQLLLTSVVEKVSGTELGSLIIPHLSWLWSYFSFQWLRISNFMHTMGVWEHAKLRIVRLQHCVQQCCLTIAKLLQDVCQNGVQIWDTCFHW